MWAIQLLRCQQENGSVGDIEGTPVCVVVGDPVGHGVVGISTGARVGCIEGRAEDVSVGVVVGDRVGHSVVGYSVGF